ncbi:hypothetical protein SAMN04489724_0743 [Algoriphagus locisalis]|uniref:Uncharacterized protein n=1 Tax=Algoriphagus locisalis TaxID=305507 RepID=A0A1I6XZZ8_9BACT|nr:hypothetical protein [Algoriphagus locisalis]SFT43541.1 hypothetical protein SAMN04489724_0743 [Algoriphagus locisalis]
MNKVILFALSSLFLIDCNAQSNAVQDLSDEKSLSYVLATIEEVVYSNHELYNRSFFVNVYIMSDSKATPEGYFEGYDGVLSSVLVSIAPDGDYYTASQLYKIEGILNPKILEMKETSYPEFVLSIEHGEATSRKVVEYKLDFKE